MTDADVAAERLAEWLAATHGGTVTSRTTPTSRGEGFDSDIHFVHLDGASLPMSWRRPLVLRVKADLDRYDEARREADIQDWVADQGFPAPRVLRVFAPGELLDQPVQVMERAEGTMMLDALRRRPWRTRALMSQLAGLHARLHALPAGGFPDDDDLLDRRLRLPRHAAEALDDDPLRAGLALVVSMADELRDSPPAVCHGDFHPLNVLVATTRASVVDWTDSGIGDRHGDIARTALLFEVAAVAATGTLDRAALGLIGPRLGRTYLRAYRRHAPVDERRLALWTPVHLLHGWSQARALHAGLLDRGEEHDTRTDRVPPGLVGQLRQRFDTACAALR